MTETTKNLTKRETKELVEALSKLTLWIDDANSSVGGHYVEEAAETFKKYGISCCPSYLGDIARKENYKALLNYVVNITYVVKDIVRHGRYTIPSCSTEDQTPAEVEA